MIFHKSNANSGWSEAIKNLKSVIEENTVLRLENDKLRGTTGEVEKQDQVKVAVKDARILNGFIWMVFIYAQTSIGQRRDNDEECAFVMNYCSGVAMQIQRSFKDVILW